MNLTAEIITQRTGELQSGKIQVKLQSNCPLSGVQPLAIVPFMIQRFEEVVGAFWHLMQSFKLLGDIQTLYIIRTVGGGKTHIQELGVDQIREIWKSEESAREWFKPSHFHFPKKGGNHDGAENRQASR
jgi:hypothetical protein